MEVDRSLVDAIGPAWFSGGADAPEAIRRKFNRLEALRVDAEQELKRIKNRIGYILSRNGCDCECEHHPEEHDDDCERCLACRIDSVIGSIDDD